MPRRAIEAADRLLTIPEVAAIFRVKPTAIRRWEAKGLFEDGTVIRTPSGHRRYKEAAVLELLRRESAP